jgi:hypothetical protein
MQIFKFLYKLLRILDNFYNFVSNLLRIHLNKSQIIIKFNNSRQIPMNSTINLTASTHQLEHVAVLEETFLGDVRFLQFNAQVQVFEHNRLDDLLRPCVGEFLVTEDLLESVQSTSRLPDFDEF